MRRFVAADREAELFEELFLAGFSCGCRLPSPGNTHTRHTTCTSFTSSDLKKGDKLMRVLKAVCCAAIVTLMAAPGVRADQWDKKTILTFSGPVQIPGATLPAGSYVFKLADLSGNRHVVQVFDKAEKKIFATLLAIPNDRMEPSDEPVVMFAERPVGSPQAVKVWYYPGERIGNEFVYPKSVAMKIAKANHQSVLAMDDTNSSDAFKTAQVGRFDENGAWQVEGNNAVATTAQATTAPRSTTASEAPRSTTMAQAAPAAGTANNTTGTSGRTRRQLPRTASPLPLYELLSGLSIAGGLIVRRMRAA